MRYGVFADHLNDSSLRGSPVWHRKGFRPQAGSAAGFFDYISGITIGSIGAELATEPESPWKPLTAMTVYGIIAVVLRVLTTKIQKCRKYINGTRPSFSIAGSSIGKT